MCRCLTAQGLRRASAELSRQHRATGTRFLRDVMGGLLQEHAHGCARRCRRSRSAGHGRSRSACGDGVERRRASHQQAHHDHDPVQGGLATAGAANWTSMFAQTDTRTNRVVMVRRDAVAAERPDRRLLEQLAAEGRRRGSRRRRCSIVGEQDTRVPMPQSVEMYRALRANGVPTRLYRRAARGRTSGANCGTSCTRPTPSSNGSSATCRGRRTRGRRAPAVMRRPRRRLTDRICHDLKSRRKLRRESG